MLVLFRKVNESIMINDDIKITVIEVNRGKVRLGIQAPNSVAVHRQEIYKQIQQSKTNDKA